MGVPRFWIEVEPEIRRWLSGLPARHFLKVEDYVDLLAEDPTVLSEPYSRHLGGPLRELRLGLGSEAMRITYWLAPAQRVVLLTVFTKTKMRETAEVTRASWAQKICAAEHGPAHDEFSRTITEGDLR
ncbi:type II toxin-antitoxin system RelE/ParE family toxin [Kitasatospora herbaricolor]|uniref:Type II toxin-antitoxin system RelE/ParE family toxin n=1 Tax=Kitasatospora herbaricolor TaxID=68217 RepID=A0ABZ1WCL2_9ACTN|nr:type II toxin-antitoxin system RelE/ParE family toxin [Kitasatospora herbaricolor]